MPKLAYRSSMPRPDDPEIIASIQHDVARGMPLRFAATRAGISPSTAYHWAIEGRRQIEAGQEQGSHALFVHALNEADAACVDLALTEWHGDPKGWARWATLLERRFPQEFGRFQRVETEQRSVSVSLSAQVPPEVLQAVARQLLDQPGGVSVSELPQGGTTVSEDPPDS